MPDTRIIENGWWVCPTCATSYAERVEGCVDCLRAEVERLTARAERLAKALDEIGDGPEYPKDFDVEGDNLKAFAEKAQELAQAALADQPAQEAQEEGHAK